MSHITYEEFTASCAQFLDVSNSIGDTWSQSSYFGTIYLVKKETRLVKKHEGRGGGKSVEVKNPTAKGADQLDESLRNLESQKTQNHDTGSSSDFEDEVLQLTYAMDSLDDDPSEHLVDKTTLPETVTFEYNIVYSIAHGVPVLCFEAYNLSGKPLKMEEIWFSVVDASFFKQIYQNRWESLTMSEHPVKGSPCYMIHPCRTADLMKRVQTEERRSVESAIDRQSEDVMLENLPGDNSAESTEVVGFAVKVDKGETASVPASIAEVNSLSGLQSRKLDGSSYIISWLSMVGPVIGLKVNTEYFKNR